MKKLLIVMGLILIHYIIRKKKSPLKAKDIVEKTIKIVDNNIFIDIEELKKIIILWQSGEFYNAAYEQGLRGSDLYGSIFKDIADHTNHLAYKTIKAAQEQLGKPNMTLDWNDLYPLTDVRSIGFNVLIRLALIEDKPPETLISDDIPVILDFLDTPPDKSLDAWNRWADYWASVDYDERRKRLFEDPRANAEPKVDTEEKIKIVENGISIDIGMLKNIIIEGWGDLHKRYYDKERSIIECYDDILDGIANQADSLAFEVEKNAQERLNRPNDRIDWFDLYPKSDDRSIEFEVLHFLGGIWSESIVKLTEEDIPYILEFLDSPDNSSLEAWEKWERYWANIDYEARLNKLPENPDYICSRGGRKKYMRSILYEFNEGGYSYVRSAGDTVLSHTKAPRRIEREDAKIIFKKEYYGI